MTDTIYTDGREMTREGAFIRSIGMTDDDRAAYWWIFRLFDGLEADRLCQSYK